MYPDNERRKKNILIGTLVGVVVLIGVLVIVIQSLHKNSTKSNTAVSTTHYDANSGDSVRTIKGEVNTYGTNPGMPIFLGIDTLITHGLSSDQATYMKQAFFNYSQVNHLNIQQVSITSSSVTTGILNPGTDNQANYANFSVIFDDKTKVTAQLQYSGLYNTELFLYDAKGTQIYDSGLLPGS